MEQSKTRYKRYYCKSCSLRIEQRQFKAKKKQPKQAAAKDPPPKKQKVVLEDSKKRHLLSLHPVDHKKQRNDSAAAIGAANSTAVPYRAKIPTVSMPDALAKKTHIPPSPISFPPSAGHSQTIVNLTSSIKLFVHRDANLGMQLVQKVHQEFKNPPGPEAFIEVLPSKGKILLF